MISVCMASCNGERYIGAQIESVLAQLGPHDELIISDDASNDRTLEVIASFSDARIHLLKEKRRLGVVKNFERALYASRGDLIFLCDQDDVWLPNKCAVFTDALRMADLVVSDCYITDSSLNILAESFFAQRGSAPGVLRNLWRNGFLGCCMAFRRELLGRALPFPAGIPMHDTWLGLVANATGRVSFVPRQTLLYRRHDTNFSPTGGTSRFSMLVRIHHRVRFASALIARLVSLKLTVPGR